MTAPNVPARPAPSSTRIDRFLEAAAGTVAPKRALSTRLLAVLALITIAGGALRFATLSQSLWWDEAVTVRDLGGSFGHMLSTVGHHELSPPLYFVLLWVWRQLFGLHAVDLRTLSALVGTLTIPVAFAAARRLVSDRAAVTVAVLLASSPAMVYYSQELRMYALLVLLCSLSLLAFLTVLRKPSARGLGAWALLSTLALGTQYFAAVLVAPQAVLLLLRARRGGVARRATATATGAVLCAGLALLALLHYQDARAYHYGQTILTSAFVSQPFNAQSVGASNSVGQIAQQLLIGPGGPSKQLVLLVVVGLGILALSMILRHPVDDPDRRGAEFALMMTLPGAATALVFLVLQIPLQGRYLLPLWLPALIAVGCGLGSARAGRIGVTATASLCALWLGVAITSATVPRLASREDSRGAARALGLAAANRLVAIDQTWDALPIQLYRPQARVYVRRLVSVSELDVVAMPGNGFPSGSYHDRPAPPHVLGLPAGMELRQIVRGSTYVVERYTASRPVALDIAPSGGIFTARWRFLYEPAGSRVGDL